MVYIKKMVMHGFKSFAKKTEVMFDRGVSVILGPNGSGKSNVGDALCFVLGRLSIKSMRAAKAKNLIFMGSKYVKPAKEAVVELIFYNGDRGFAIDKDEVHLTRIVRHNGQSIYKINDESKTRAEIIEMLAQAGIDPHGFNIILQGEIQSIVRMHPEERRKVIEEVAGISIYESRKEKSIHELDKTDEKLKEISAILRERNIYLKNLDAERNQALKFRELENTVKRCKASVLYKNLNEKDKELSSVLKSVESKIVQKDKIKIRAEKIQNEIEQFNEKINLINKNIQQATGFEQEKLHEGIANLKAELEGLRVRKENYENRKAEIERRIEEISKSIPEIESEIDSLKNESPLIAKKSQDLKKKKEEFSQIEEERNKLLGAKSELLSINAIMKDKERQLARINSDGETILKQIENVSQKMLYRSEDECSKELNILKKTVLENENKEIQLQKREIESEKKLAVLEREIERFEKIKIEIDKIELCPLCQSKISLEHKDHVISDSDKKIQTAKKELLEFKEKVKEITSEKESLFHEIRKIKEKILVVESELIRHKSVAEKQNMLKKVVEDEKSIKNSMHVLDDRKRNLEIKVLDLSKVQEKYDSKILEIEEISSRTEEDVDTTLLYKERELENIRNIIKRSKKDIEDIENLLNGIDENSENKAAQLDERESQEKDLNERFKKMFDERDKLQKSIQEHSVEMSESQSEMKQFEEQINYLKIGKAKLEAEKEALSMEMSEFSGIELINASINILEEKLRKAQETLTQIGSINMRALEMYDQVKKEYDEVQEKVNTLEKEKLDILEIIAEIDKKKIKSFMKTFKAINELFSRNFSRLSAKGTAFLDIENKEDVFAGGVSIVVRLAKGKYFDVTSLSGGEQTLVALSLLFAIQEFKPYHFYIFDEIDAALDKRNSERLAALLQQYMKSGQYIVITHNDAIIQNSNILYGISMHEGVSKILSLKLDGNNNDQGKDAGQKEDIIEDKVE
ncbi:chromosome segregation protein SMC [Candidatus Pacearchaeota archaeon]|nr:chromosome segregation protein SMC [Candidatus Pacearchaeota archaeon]